MLINILIACILSGICYRAGGMGKEDTANPKWIPKWMRNTKTRDWGCPLVLLALTVALFGLKWALWWVYALVFGLSWEALTTYGDKIFGYDNFYFHGFLSGLAGIPLIIVGIPWYFVAIRTIICTLGMGLWSKYIGNDVAEETGRGILFII